MHPCTAHQGTKKTNERTLLLLKEKNYLDEDRMVNLKRAFHQDIQLVEYKGFKYPLSNQTSLLLKSFLGALVVRCLGGEVF